MRRKPSIAEPNQANFYIKLDFLNQKLIIFI